MKFDTHKPFEGKTDSKGKKSRVIVIVRVNEVDN
jgi:hypothetical protein